MIEEVRRTGMSMSALRASDPFIETFTPELTVGLLHLGASRPTNPRSGCQHKAWGEAKRSPRNSSSRD